MANYIFDDNCGVIGCWGKDSQGRTTLNGQPFETMMGNFDKITEKDLEELKKIQPIKIVFTKPFAIYKVGDILDVKVFSNLYQSEPPSFLVVDEKLGSHKYPFGGRGSTPFYEEYKGTSTLPSTDVAPETFFQKHKNHLLIIGAVVLGYLAYKKFKK
jgi:hypothetical protein